MLALGVQEQSQLRLLESSLSNTVNHQWPILHAQFIDEPTSNKDQEEQGPLKSKVQESHLPQTDLNTSLGNFRVPELTCYNHWHYKGHCCIDSDVMLGTLERVSPMEVSPTSEKMVPHASAEPSPVQDRGDFLEITIHPELSADQHEKDDQTLSQPVSELFSKAACTEDMVTEAGLHSEQNERLDNLHPEIDDAPEIKEYEICGKLSDTYSLSEPQNSDEQLSNGQVHKECNLVMSLKDTSLTARDKDSCLCLADPEVPLVSSSFDNQPGESLDIHESPVQHKETLVCKELNCSGIGEDNSLLSMSSEENAPNQYTQPPNKERVENDVSNVMESSNVHAQRPELSCAEGHYKNTQPLKHAQMIDCSLAVLQSPNRSMDLLSKYGKEIQLTQSNLLESPECSFPLHTNTDVSAVFSNNLTCANKLEENINQSSNTSSIVSSPSVEATCIAFTCSLSEDNTACDAIVKSEGTPDKNVTTKLLHGSELTQTPEPRMVPTAGLRTVASLQLSTENEKNNTLQTSYANKALNPDNDITCLEHTSHIQAPDLMGKETKLSMEPWEEVPCQMASNHNTFQDCQSSDVTLSLKATAQNALVPYVDIWTCITTPSVPNIWPLKASKNVIKKAKCKKLKGGSVLYAKGKNISNALPDHDEKHGILVPSISLTNLIKSPKNWPIFERNISKNPSAGCPSKKRKESMSVTLPKIKAENIYPSSSDPVGINNQSVSLLADTASASTPKCFIQRQENLRPLNLSSNHVVKSTGSPQHTLASNLAHTDGIKQGATVSPILTRSRRKMCFMGPSGYMQKVKPASPSTLSKKLTLNLQTDVGKCRLSPTIQGHSRRKSLPEITAGAVKPKRAYVKAEQNIPSMNIDKKTPPLVKERLRNEVPTTCQMERKFRATKGTENCSLKLETKSLHYCATRETKRPKIYKGNCSQPIISDFQSGIETISSNTRNIYSSPPRPSPDPIEVQQVPNIGSVIGQMPLKRQPFRKCKNISLQQNVKLNPKMQACKLSSTFRAHASYIPDHKRLSPGYVASSIAPDSLNHNGGIINPRIKRTRLQISTPEQALLHQLSAIANRLTAPSESSLMSKTLSGTTRGVQLQARKLLNVFSCVNMKMSSLSTGNPVTIRDHRLSHSMDLLPTHFCSNDIAHQFSLPASNNSTFPVSFHMKVDSNFLSDFISFNPPDYVFKNALPIAQSSQLPEWTLSFFLSPHFAADDNVQLFTHWKPNFRCSDSSRCDSNYRSVSKRSSGCSMLGLHTVLALSSPGCYRLWTRKRNLGSRMPTVQKLSVMQFAHGLKGLPPQCSQKRGMSSLAFSLGHVLSMWSRHGSSAFSFDSTTPHPHCQDLWQSGQSINIRSSDPQLCTTPDLFLDVGRRSSFSFSSPNLPLDLLPKICFGANKSRFSLSSVQEIDISPSHCLPGLPNDSALSEKGVVLWHSCPRATDPGIHKEPLEGLSANLEETPLYLCTEQSSLQASLSAKLGDKFSPWPSLLKETDDASQLSTFKQNDGLDPLPSLSTQPNDLQPIVSVLAEQDYASKLNTCLPTEQVHSPEPQCLPSKLADCLGLLSSSFSERNGTGPLHSLSTQHVYRFPHNVPAERANALGFSQLCPSKPGDLESPCHLPPQETNGPKPQPYLSTQKECNYGPLQQSLQEDIYVGQSLCLFSKKAHVPRILSNPSNKQNKDFVPLQNIATFPQKKPKPLSLSVATNDKAGSLEQRETVPVLQSKAGNCIQETKKEVERKPQRVSQIKIRKTIPKPDPNLTPMGLPKTKRINKKEFTLEDIYTNKNYKSPPPARSLETIFEEPKEKNGVLMSVSQTKRKRILEFRDCTAPRPKRAKGKVRVVASCKRGRKAAMEEVQLDALLIQKLMDLENFLLEQESLEGGSETAENLS